MEPKGQSLASQETHIPTVSIGMPILNGEKCIRKALDSMLGQTFTDFELIISDNASTDYTGMICQEYARRDVRIRYIRQPKNRGACANFQFVLAQARGEFFMWTSHDDIKSANFIQVNLDFLRHNLDFVASTSPVRFDGGKFHEIKMGDASLVGEKSQRIMDFFRRWHANGYIYSLMRTAALKDCKAFEEDFLAVDMAVIIRMADKGKFNRVSEGWVVLGRGGASKNKGYIRSYRRNWLNFFFPIVRLYQITWGLSRDFSLPDKMKIALILFIFNTKVFICQFVELGKIIEKFEELFTP